MRLIKKITNDLTWIGVNNRRLAMFEGVYSVPKGVSYNSYLLTDEKTVLFDTVEVDIFHRFYENLVFALGERELDYLIVQHLEPDHSAGVKELAARYPRMKIVCNNKSRAMIKQFYDLDIEERSLIVKEGDSLNTGKHSLHFIMAPMVHWPEVMVTYDPVDKILFSADGFGCFGALNGALFADEVNFNKDYMDEARRYYTNIVGKYGTQVQSLLNKASSVDIRMICPLHGFVWRNNIKDILMKYTLWSVYEPEEYGVMIAYASVYGNTENAAEILSSMLRDRGVKTEMFDVSVTPSSEILSAAFRWSHMVFASTTYNAGVFVTMEALINDLTAHNIQNRTVAIIENGSWAAASGGLIREKLEKCKNIHFIENFVSIKSSLKKPQMAEISSMADAIAASFQTGETSTEKTTGGPPSSGGVNPAAMFKLSYGLFILTAKDGDKDNGCVINTVSQVTDDPIRITITVNKKNLTHHMIMKTGVFNLSVLTENAPFSVYQRFGFASGKDKDKFQGVEALRGGNGLLYLTEHTNSVISGKVTETMDCGTHSVFIADVTQAFILNGEASVTYQYYFDHVKPAPPKPVEGKKGFVCKICGYVYEGDSLPGDYICPLCKHGPADFEPI